MESAALSQIIERVRDSARAGTGLRVSGGGTKDFIGGDSVAKCRAERLDMRRHLGVVDYEPSELVVTVRAGTRLSELEAELASRGQCLPFEPPRFGEGSTVGGMVAAGLSGPARASVGAVRDYVLGIEIINGKGELLRFGGQVMKNVAGYDVSRVMAGSWGTLGVITEVSLKVLPVPVAETTLKFELDQAAALAQLHAWGGQPLPVNASCWVEDGGKGQLYVRLRGARAAVEAACASMGGERQDSAQVAADWHACRDHALPWFADRAARPELALWRLSVPQTAPVLALPEGVAPALVEWQGALRWVQAPLACGAALQATAQAVGGSALLFAAPAQGAAHEGEALPTPPSAQPALAAITERLRQAFDPSGIFQPLRMGTGG
ncbi:glycolate oxidase subunit GlcE [Diaphorobacter aerolatus]|uniref:Glycolate oxidase subunit GlcE n=1 Tax=Diaphorobacter aerolatus TaxID=1288495 RepID=A0A7H0GFV6_9BURK|nr:glycolate oxidase subunit GlcE [Diaphorobacter aerolatus]QNP47172.1 glycolate oxidase subunit GlcE [Diaphorobacter aerolatus]